MPARNVVKNYEADSMYHIYNRGNGKRTIFHDKRDYAVFLSYLKFALLSADDYKPGLKANSSLLPNAQLYNFRRLGLADRLDLVAFCLMPNHYHLLLFQHDCAAITALMRSISTGYSMYYNKRYNRSGSLMQGVYKAVPMKSEGQWQHISRYIHLNPIDLGVEFSNYEYSSFKYYIGKANADWIKPQMGMTDMKQNEYEQFVKDWVPFWRPS